MTARLTSRVAGCLFATGLVALGAGCAASSSAVSPAGSVTPTGTAAVTGPAAGGAATGALAGTTVSLGGSTTVGSTAAGGDPFAGARLYVDPASDAARSVAALQRSNPTAARAVARIAGAPEAYWVGGNDAVDVRGQVGVYVAAVRAVGALPLLVAYNIPDRDCGGYSSGGARTPADYRAWIRAFADGIGSGPAAVILEPDSLASVACLTDAARDARFGLLSDAVGVLTARGVTVYLDGGNSHWMPAATMATRLAAAGVARARGFALNVSNFDVTADEASYGQQIDQAMGQQAHFVVDTSRNGLGPEAGRDWCNPPGRALGSPPTAVTGNPLADAYLWVKHPGESDGTCHGGPAAGAWWSSYAIGLAERARD
jgi:endoglucanase